jgi:hypothetical protein
MYRPLLVILLPALLLGGCMHRPAPSAECTGLFEQLQAATASVRDGQYHLLHGFAGLRSERSLALLGQSANSTDQRRLWLQRLSELDAQASQIEISQLPAPQRQFWTQPAQQKALASCRTSQIDALLNEPDAFPQILQAAQVPDDYRGWARALGLYPLFKPAYRRGIDAWQKQAEQARSPEDSGHWLGYQPFPIATSVLKHGLQDDILGLPQADAEQLKALFARHAPWLKINQANRHDRIGSPGYRNDGTRELQNNQPRLYRHTAWSQVEGRWHLQLIYQFWFSQRPKQHALDLFGGELDGLIWRVTLDQQGNALLYDSIHPCGCWHAFYLPADSPWQLQVPAGEEPRQARRLDFNGDQAATLWLASVDHQLQWVDDRRSPYPSMLYQIASLDQLRQLPHPNGRRSLYRPDGLVPGTQRLERWLLWPSGVQSPGAMRQWGRHATAFIGRAHFDDPKLLDRYIQTP